MEIKPEILKKLREMKVKPEDLESLTQHAQRVLDQPVRVYDIFGDLAYKRLRMVGYK